MEESKEYMNPGRAISLLHREGLMPRHADDATDLSQWILSWECSALYLRSSMHGVRVRPRVSRRDRR